MESDNGFSSDTVQVAILRWTQPQSGNPDTSNDRPHFPGAVTRRRGEYCSILTNASTGYTLSPPPYLLPRLQRLHLPKPFPNRTLQRAGHQQTQPRLQRLGAGGDVGCHSDITLLNVRPADLPHSTRVFGETCRSSATRDA